MSEMVEKVARAIRTKWANDSTAPFPLYDEEATMLAVAAIAAMRNHVTEGMVVKGRKALLDLDARTGDDYGMKSIWEAMVDDALNPDPNAKRPDIAADFTALSTPSPLS